MRIHQTLFLIAGFLSFVLAFETEDHEIFDLTDALTKFYPTANFYSILEVEPTADESTISKQYRKISRKFHPDKNPGDEAASMHKLLTSISSVLKDSKLRERYDKHLAKGFPTWRGSGYYYSRFEPGFIFIAIFLLLAISFAQYVINWVFYYRQLTSMKETEPVETTVKTYTQMKKQLKKQGTPDGSPILSKKDFKKGLGAELLQPTPVQVLAKPSLNDVVIVQVPKYLINLPLKYFSKETINKKHE